MAPLSSLPLFLSVFFLAVATASFAIFAERDDVVSNDNPLIRQVVGDDDQLLTADHHFSLFKKKFGKSYASKEEHDYRFAVFKANMRRALRHQKLDPSALHGVTKFSDLTPAEFRRNFLGLRSKLKFPAHANKAPILPTDDLPTDFDWREHGAVTPVKNQVEFLPSSGFELYNHQCAV